MQPIPLFRKIEADEVKRYRQMYAGEPEVDVKKSNTKKPVQEDTGGVVCFMGLMNFSICRQTSC
jgi:hypothetical protein